MQTLALFRSSDVDANAKPLDEASYKPRTAGRAIIFDGEKVALLHVANSGYYTLPGGGIDNDDLTSGLKREVMEEIGCEIEVGKEVGSAVVYFDRWKNRQVD
jgi:8-oxo-dGTP pyrophosphatase MutT (NUDIX family)